MTHLSRLGLLDKDGSPMFAFFTMSKSAQSVRSDRSKKHFLKNYYKLNLKVRGH